MQQVVFFVLKSFIWLVSKLPFRLLYAAATLTYILVFYIIGYRKKVVSRNLKLVFPDYSEAKIKQIRKQFYKHLCDFMFETIKSYSLKKQEAERRFVYTNLEILDPIHKAGKSVLLWCGHYSTWEWSGILNHQMEFKGYAVYKPMDNKNMDNLVRKIRGRFGATIVSNKQIVKTLIKDKQNQVQNMTLMLSDQTPRPNATKHWDEFMGINVPVFTGGETLANKLDLAHLYLKVQKVKRGYYTASFVPLVASTDKENPFPITRAFLDQLESQIKEQPEYYLWSHRRWKYRKTD